MNKRLPRRSLCAALVCALCAVLCFAALPASAQDWAKQILDKSPRHQEWVKIPVGNKTLDTFVVYPQVSHKAPVIVMIHEIFGLSDWARSMADDLAAQGYIVVEPDLLSGTGPNGGGSSAYPDQDARVKAVSGLNHDDVMADLDAAADWGLKQPSANGKLAVVGFCWGGTQSFAFATRRHDLTADFVFYGTMPQNIFSITAPVYGFYGGADNRVTSTVPATEAAMKAAGKKYEPVIYPGAGHGFMRSGEDPSDTNPANAKARKEGLARLERLLKTM